MFLGFPAPLTSSLCPQKLTWRSKPSDINVCRMKGKQEVSGPWSRPKSATTTSPNTPQFGLASPRANPLQTFIPARDPGVAMATARAWTRPQRVLRHCHAHRLGLAKAPPLRRLWIQRTNFPVLAPPSAWPHPHRSPILAVNTPTSLGLQSWPRPLSPRSPWLLYSLPTPGRVPKLCKGAATSGRFHAFRVRFQCLQPCLRQLQRESPPLEAWLPHVHPPGPSVPCPPLAVPFPWRHRLLQEASLHMPSPPPQPERKWRLPRGPCGVREAVLPPVTQS